MGNVYITCCVKRKMNFDESFLDHSDVEESYSLDEGGMENTDAYYEEIFRQEVRLWLSENAEELFCDTNASWKLKKYTAKRPQLKKNEKNLTNK